MRNIGVVFNIYELSGLIVDNEFHSAGSLSESQKVGFPAILFIISYTFSFGEKKEIN